MDPISEALPDLARLTLEDGEKEEVLAIEQANKCRAAHEANDKEEKREALAIEEANQCRTALKANDVGYLGPKEYEGFVAEKAVVAVMERIKDGKARMEDLDVVLYAFVKWGCLTERHLTRMGYKEEENVRKSMRKLQIRVHIPYQKLEPNELNAQRLAKAFPGVCLKILSNWPAGEATALDTFLDSNVIKRVPLGLRFLQVGSLLGLVAKGDTETHEILEKMAHRVNRSFLRVVTDFVGGVPDFERTARIVSFQLKPSEKFTKSIKEFTGDIEVTPLVQAYGKDKCLDR